VTGDQSFRLVLTGQSLIERPLHLVPSAGSQHVRELIRAADLAITNLEVAIETPEGRPVRETTSHTAGEQVLDTLAWFGFQGVALASNHAFDLGPAGIVAALEATKRRGMITAGTGRDAATAAIPGVAMMGSTTVALHAVVAAQNPTGAHALDATESSAARAGVNRLRMPEPAATQAWQTPDPSDVSTLLRSVRASARYAEIVIVYLHNHYWASPAESTPSWVEDLARRCIDDGASVVFGHGTPAMQGIELYRGRLILYGLGSLVFHTRKPECYDTTAWESVVVDAEISSGGGIDQVRLHPLIHGCHPERDPSDGSDGSPAIAEPATAQAILGRLDRLSARFGTAIEVTPDGCGTVRLAASAQ